MIRIHQVNGGYVEIIRRKKRPSTSCKRGRPRKEVAEQPQIKTRKKPYSIILTSRNKQKECIKTFRTEKEAYEYFFKLKEENKSILFPVKYISNKGLKEANYELYIIKRIDDDSEKQSTLLRNDLGEFVEHTTNMDKWQIIDKCKWNVEETFWVNGFDPFLQRKNFKWIFENFISNDTCKYSSFKNVLVYQNKLIIDDNGNLNIVFCKNISDSFRLYSEIESLVQEKKYKNIMFSGNIRNFSKSTISEWIDKLCEVTHFNRTKIKRKTLSNT